MEVTPPIDGVDSALDCVCLLQWETGEEVLRASTPHRQPASQNFTHNPTDLETPQRTKRNKVLASEWFGIVPFSTIEGSIHVLRSNFAVHSLSDELPWTDHRFYINRFYREPTIAGNRKLICAV